MKEPADDSIPSDTPQPNETSQQWRTIAQLSDMAPKGLFDVVLDDQLILLTKTDDGIRAFQGQCPHQFARLVGGRLVDGQLCCPRHMAFFRLSDGACTNGWQLPPLKRYAVRVTGDAIEVPYPLEPLS